jgi:sulfate/thiosulfate transport system ATP-binding protein
MDIHIQNIHKDFGSFKALDGVDLDIQSGELIALLGPSGSGKTTLLRVIAGLEFADAGAIRFGGEDMARVPVRERQVGFVFQHYALFKHMTVLDNVGFGLSVRKDRPSKDAIRQRALELLDLVQLSGLEKRYPAQLSGGQRQRVALARALAIDPKVLLLDEPFGALDAKVRKDLRRWLRELHDKTGVTTVFVTHDQEEALELADRVVIMNKGRIEQVGHVDTVYEQPANPFVFDFLGGTNVLPVEIADQAVRLPGQAESIADTRTPLSGQALLYVRPGDIRLATEPAAGLQARIARVHRTGPLIRIDARVSATDTPLSIELPHLHHDTQAFQAGAEVRLRLLQFSVYPATPAASAGPTVPDAIGVAASRRRAR